MLQDNNFRWLLRVSPAAAVPDGSRAEYLAAVAQPYLELPCGIIRGERMRQASLRKNYQTEGAQMPKKLPFQCSH